MTQYSHYWTYTRRNHNSKRRDHLEGWDREGGREEEEEEEEDPT